ncbi:GH25 family lysozyme [Streptomyces misionensis]|uniref:GH25 family lysozyme n=1 Tax=Streptomyces misionensis TaxID=67331 RepID=UPI00343B71C1
MATCRGIDVSAYQGAQDWTAWKKQGITFAFAKASEGQSTHDPKFATHIKGIKGAGLIPGAYHFAWPNQDPRKEAANYISAVKPYAGKGFTHWLDLERYSDGRNYRGKTDTQIREWVTTWLAAVRTAFPGQRVGVYTSADDLAKGHVPSGTPLWYPAYPGTSVDTFAEAQAHSQPSPSGWKPLIWQFTSDPAGPDRIDQSIAYLSASDFRAWAGEAPTPAPAPKPSVSLAHVVAAAKKDPSAAQGHTTYKAEVLVVERALQAEKFLAAQYVDGSFGSLTVNAYARWQRALGYSGSAADGIPGKTSLTKLGDKHGFTVTT